MQRTYSCLSALAMLTVTACLVTFEARSDADDAAVGGWPIAGRDLTNSRNQPQTPINRANVSQLTPQWVFKTDRDVP